MPKSRSTYAKRDHTTLRLLAIAAERVGAGLVIPWTSREALDAARSLAEAGSDLSRAAAERRGPDDAHAAHLEWTAELAAQAAVAKLLGSPCPLHLRFEGAILIADPKKPDGLPLMIVGELGRAKSSEDF